MNKKSIAALALAATLTLGVGASYAWFTSQATSTNNSVQTGTLSIGGPEGTSAIRTFTLSNLYPGAEGSKNDYITVRNNGSINLQYKVSAALSTGEESLYNIAKVKVTKDSGEIVYDGNLNALNGYLANSNLPVGSSERLAYTVSLPDNADNSYQGKTAYVNFVIDATQYNDTSFIVNNGSGHSVVNVKADATNTDGVNFSTLQAAINAVPNGGTINVAAGTYKEQVNIDGKNITINGETKNGARLVTIVSPTILSTLFTTTSSQAKPIIGIKNTNNFNINNIIVDGNREFANNSFMGIGTYNSSGSINNCEIKNIMGDTVSGVQNGIGIYVYNTDGTQRTFNIDRNVIYNYNKGGIVISGGNLTGNVTNNTVTGQNVKSIIGQNGIQISYGATGIVKGNTVTNNLYYSGTEGDHSAGILLFDAVGMKTEEQIQADNPNVQMNDINVWKEQ